MAHIKIVELVNKYRPNGKSIWNRDNMPTNEQADEMMEDLKEAIAYTSHCEVLAYIEAQAKLWDKKNEFTD